MDINNISPNEFIDLFSPTSPEQQKAAPTKDNLFSSGSTDVDILGVPPAKVEPAVSSEEKIITPAQTQEGKDPQDTDILTTPKVDPIVPGAITDISGYFQDRIKNGKFVALEQEDENGEIRQFVPKTAEEFDEVIDLQVNYQLEQKTKELDKVWYNSKSDAWKAVAQYAELTDDISQIIPFVQGVQNIQNVAALDEKTPAGAEQIIRLNLQAKDIDPELIESNIENLRTKDALVSTAERLKPTMVQAEQQRLSKMQKEQEQELQNYYSMVNNFREKAIEAIEKPLFGKHQLKQDEKHIVYQMIGQPDPEKKGYGIYDVIDSLFQKNDFETLRDVALLLGKKDAFFTYSGIQVANKTAASLQNKLRISTENRGSSGKDFHEEKTPAKKPLNVSGGGFGMYTK